MSDLRLLLITFAVLS